MTLEQLILALKILIGAYFDSKVPEPNEIDFLKEIKKLIY